MPQEKSREFRAGEADDAGSAGATKTQGARRGQVEKSQEKEPSRRIPKMQGTGLTVDLAADEVMVGGKPVTLSRLEWSILATLARSEGRTVSRSLLGQALWGKEWDGLSRGVDVVVARIRRKLGDRSCRQRIIQTVRFDGYRLVCKVANGTEEKASKDGT